MDQAASNRRDYFRLGFDGLPGTMQIFEVDQNPISVEPRAIDIFNLGGGGLYMRTDVDLPIRNEVYASFTFTLLGQPFTLRGSLVRKTDDKKRFWYGVTFIDMEEHDRGPLVSLLNRVQIDRSRKGRVAQL